MAEPKKLVQFAISEAEEKEKEVKRAERRHSGLVDGGFLDMQNTLKRNKKNRDDKLRASMDYYAVEKDKDAQEFSIFFIILYYILYIYIYIYIYILNMICFVFVYMCINLFCVLYMCINCCVGEYLYTTFNIYARFRVGNRLAKRNERKSRTISCASGYNG